MVQRAVLADPARCQHISIITAQRDYWLTCRDLQVGAKGAKGGGWRLHEALAWLQRVLGLQCC